MKAVSVPLGENIHGKIYRGILTGFNEAFVIDQRTRDRLIAADEKSEEIIKPFVVGEDVKRYSIDYKKRHIILTRIGTPIERYPAIFAHLQRYQEQLEKRWDKGNHWWELRACDYYEEQWKWLVKRRLNKLDLVELTKVFRLRQPAIAALDKRIATTDRLIDQVVYRPYGLAEEEVATVEARTR